MAPGIIRLVSSRKGLSLAVFLARALPKRPGYAFARTIADMVAAQKQSALVRAVRANQWVVAEGKLSPAALDERVRSAFRTMARDIFEVYHYMANLSAARSLFVIDPSFEMLMRRPAFDPPGIMVAGPHYGSFNISLHYLARHLLNPLVLTVPDPQGSLELEFEIRRRTGMNLMPASFNGIREAAHYLKKGGVVLTGLDRPAPGGQSQLRFFHRSACLPCHHIHLAINAGAPVVVVVNRREADGKYHLYASPPIEMERRADRVDELHCNAEKVLEFAEGYIRQDPGQWTMTHPVWPEVLQEI